jgi:hypothetical protein
MSGHMLQIDQPMSGPMQAEGHDIMGCSKFVIGDSIFLPKATIMYASVVFDDHGL